MHPFVRFGPSHWIAIALTLLAPLALMALSRGRPDRNRRIRFTLAAVLALNWAGWMLFIAAKGWLDIGNELPLNLCDWATLATLIALVHLRQETYEIAYFWALCGTTQALVTPDCRVDFPDPQFVAFFVYHSGIVAAVLWMTLGLKMRPRRESLPRVAAWSLLYAAVAGAADWLLGTDYGFLRSKPSNPTLLDYFAPWPWYLPELVLAGMAFMLVMYAPFGAMDVLRAARPKAA